ncbi:MAG: hypothetical protein NWE92_07665 [Candidatus Bathyarchaeota archaeon]|nr:hypothetical protein [Candidatus Bathyarchaeota archaeon]
MSVPSFDLGGVILPLGDAGKSLFPPRTSLNIEPIEAFSYTPYTLLKYDENTMLIGTTDAKVFKAIRCGSGLYFEKIFDGSPSSGSTFVHKSSSGHLFVSIASGSNTDGKVWRSTNQGATWTSVLTLSSTKPDSTTQNNGSVPTFNFVDLGNGRHLLGEWCDFTAPLIYISTDYGATWSVWTNFTTMFPLYAVPSPLSPTNFYDMRHIHSMNWIPETHTLIVAIGDSGHSMWKYAGNPADSTDATDPTNAANWTNVCGHNGYCAFINMGDYTIYFGDGWTPAIKYTHVTNTWAPVFNPLVGICSANVIFKHIVFDSENGVLYAGTDNSPNPAAGGYDTYQSIIVSFDLGNSWKVLTRLKATADHTSASVDLCLFGDYIYFADRNAGATYPLGRFKRLTRAEANYIIDGADKFSCSTFGAGGIAVSSRTLLDAIITVTSASVTNLLVNPNFNSGPYVSTPSGWTAMGSVWTSGSVTFSDGGAGILGSHSIMATLTGYGSNAYLYQGYNNLPAGTYVAFCWVKINTGVYPHLRHSLYATHSGVDLGSHGAYLNEYYVGNFRLLTLSFVNPVQQLVNVKYNFISSGSSSAYTIDAGMPLQITVCAFGLYAYPDATSLEIPAVSPYSTGTTSSGATGTLYVGNRKITWTSLPATLNFGTLSGFLRLALISGGLVNVAVSGSGLVNKYLAKVKSEV